MRAASEGKRTMCAASEGKHTMRAASNCTGHEHESHSGYIGCETDIDRDSVQRFQRF
jgi:hypothetical protein